MLDHSFPILANRARLRTSTLATTINPRPDQCRQTDSLLHARKSLQFLSRSVTPKHNIHLLQRLSLRLRHAKPNKHTSRSRPKCKEQIRPISNATQHRRDHKRDDEVIHPVC